MMFRRYFTNRRLVSLRGSVQLDMKGVKQRQSYTCGLAAAYSVVNFLAPEVKFEEIVRAINPDRRKGTSQNRLVTGLRKLGVSASLYYNLGWRDYTNAIDSGKPVILYDHYREHWELLYGYQQSRGSRFFLVSDSLYDYGIARHFTTFKKDYRGFGIICSKRRE